MNRTQRVRRFRLATLALSVGAVLAMSLPAALPVLAAGNATAKVLPAVEPATGPGGTFTVNVVSNADVATTTFQATVKFDPALLQIVSVSRPATGWGATPNFVGPTGDLTVAANLAAAVAIANGSGELATVAAFLTPPATIPAGADQGFLDITFQVIRCPSPITATTDISLKTSAGGADTQVLDASGDPAVLTVVKSTVTPCSNSTDNATTHVTSTLDGGFLSLKVDPGFQIPLLRLVTNTVDVPVKVFSDGGWTLKVDDAMTGGKNAADRGHMTQATPFRRLALPMQAYAVPFSTPPGPLVRTLDQTAPGATDLITGSGIATQLVTLSQYVGPTDPGPASYSINLVFTATSGF